WPSKEKCPPAVTEPLRSALAIPARLRFADTVKVGFGKLTETVALLMWRKFRTVKLIPEADSVKCPLKLMVPTNVTRPTTGTLGTLAVRVRLDEVRVNDAVSKWTTPGTTSMLCAVPINVNPPPDPIWPVNSTLLTRGMPVAMQSNASPELLRVTLAPL